MLAESPYREWVEEGSVVSVDRFLDEKEMFAAASAVDLVVTPYPRHQNRSSIILWAAAAGRPSLGTNSSCIAHVINHEQLGMTSDVLDKRVLADAIDAALNMPWSEQDAARVRRYAEFHRIENYQRLSSELVRERLAMESTASDPEPGG
jgi:glycosyltransferase involved in cell wall biosynthesis